MKKIIYTVFVLLLTLFYGCTVMPANERDKLLNERMGNYAEAETLIINTVLRDPEMEVYIRDIMKEIDPINGIANRIYILNTPWVNAFVCPNKTIFVTSGLLDTYDSKSELAFVLGHEMTHSNYKDAITKMQEAEESRAAGAYVGAFFGDLLWLGIVALSAYAGVQPPSNIEKLEFIFSDIGGSLSYTMKFEGYSQDAELRADRESAVLGIKAGYDKKGMISALQKLKKVEQMTKSSNVRSSFVNAKPGLEERIEELKNVIKKSEASN